MFRTEYELQSNAATNIKKIVYVDQLENLLHFCEVGLETSVIKYFGPEPFYMLLVSDLIFQVNMKFCKLL